MANLPSPQFVADDLRDSTSALASPRNMVVVADSLGARRMREVLNLYREYENSVAILTYLTGKRPVVSGIFDGITSDGGDALEADIAAAQNEMNRNLEIVKQACLTLADDLMRHSEKK